MKLLKCRTHMNKEIDEKDVKVQIERIHDNKHNMIPIVKLVVYQPIVSLLKPDVLTSDVPANIVNEISVNKEKAEHVMETLKEIGNVPSEDIYIQLTQLKQQIDDIITETIPEIKQIVDFYSIIVAKDYCFLPTSNGQKAKQRLYSAISNCDVACNGLKTLYVEEEKASFICCNLYQIVEKVLEGTLDSIIFDVKYDENIDRNKEYCVKIDVDTFAQKVLMNIKHNIESHAFPNTRYEGVMFWEKKVKVSIVEAEDSVEISIANNGVPFEGDPIKAFDYGYCYGPTRHTGFGLDSAKKYMELIEGNIELLKTPDSEYKVTYLITLKKKE